MKVAHEIAGVGLGRLAKREIQKMTEQIHRPFILVTGDEGGLPVEQHGAAYRFRDQKGDDHASERGRRKAC